MVQIKPKLNIKIRANATCTSHSRADVRVRDVGFTIDEPIQRGGANMGPAPTDTAVAALIGCTNTIGHKCADKHGIDIGHLEIEAICDFDRRGVTLQEEIDVPFRKIEVDVLYSGTATPDEAELVAQETEKYCPVSKLFRQAGTELTHKWQRKTA